VDTFLNILEMTKHQGCASFARPGPFICWIPVEYPFRSAMIKMIKTINHFDRDRDSSKSLNFKIDGLGLFYQRKYGLCSHFSSFPGHGPCFLLRGGFPPELLKEVGVTFF